MERRQHKEKREDLTLKMLGGESTLIVGGAGSGKGTTSISLATEAFTSGYTVFMFDVAGGVSIQDFLNSIPKALHDRVIVREFSDLNDNVPSLNLSFVDDNLTSSELWAIGKYFLSVLETLTGVTLTVSIANFMITIGASVIGCYKGTLYQAIEAISDREFLSNDVLPKVYNPVLKSKLSEYCSYEERFLKQITGALTERLFPVYFDEFLCSMLKKKSSGMLDYTKALTAGAYAVLVNMHNYVNKKEVHQVIVKAQLTDFYLSIRSCFKQGVNPKPFYLILNDPETLRECQDEVRGVVTLPTDNKMKVILTVSQVEKNDLYHYLVLKCNYNLVLTKVMRETYNVLVDVLYGDTSGETRNIIFKEWYSALVRLSFNPSDVKVVNLPKPPVVSTPKISGF